MAPRRLSWRLERVASIFAVLAAVAISSGHAQAAGDGELLFKKNCLVCQTVEKGGAKRQGPNLWAIIGRTAGSIDGFPYSKGLKVADWPWTPEALDKWLEDPHAVFSDTYVVYRRANAEVRHKIIAFPQTKVD